MDDMEARLVRCFLSVFSDLSADQIHNASVQSLAAWDSLTGVTLAAVLQEEFALQINPVDLPELQSFEAVLSYIRRRRVSFPDQREPATRLIPVRDVATSAGAERGAIADLPARKHVKEGVVRGASNRLLQHFARIVPGSSLRVRLHRARGVQIGTGVWIGYDVILETSSPHLIMIADRATLSMRVTVIAHFKETQGVRIEEDAFIGPGAIILPGVVIGRGAVVTAGSVVTRSVPPMTIVQGNPAVVLAECGVPLTPEVTLKEFSRRLKLHAVDKPIALGER
jgi:acetyltransferase-like isoleucine patch superfamily enzyme/acyl carrier protein